jgi:lipopolysaccharide transport system ATP-binding protein
MPETVIKVERLSKKYQLGTIGYGSLAHDLAARWARARGREDPNAKIGEKSRLDLHGDFWALKGINFEVKRGERVGIIGRNGAGKSTLFKILSQVTRPTEGTIRLKGRVASLLEVGTGFHPELTGRENVFLNGAIIGMKRREIQQKFEEIVDFSGVEQFIDTPVKRYSSGMYVRLGFAVAAHLEPDILVVDEVLSVGDADFQRKCIRKMEAVSKEQGRTVLLVSHNLSTVRRLCDTTVLFEKGQVALIGATAQVIDDYLKDAAASGRHIDLTGTKANYYSGQIDILSLTLENAANDTFSLAWDEPLRLRIQYRVNRKIKDLWFSVGISTTDNVNIFSSPSHSTPMAIDSPGVYEGILFVNQRLRFGLYAMHLGAVSGTENIWWKENVTYLEILQFGKMEYEAQLAGMVHFDYSWTFQERNGSTDEK